MAPKAASSTAATRKAPSRAASSKKTSPDTDTGSSKPTKAGVAKPKTTTTTKNTKTTKAAPKSKATKATAGTKANTSAKRATDDDKPKTTAKPLKPIFPNLGQKHKDETKKATKRAREQEDDESSSHEEASGSRKRAKPTPKTASAKTKSDSKSAKSAPAKAAGKENKVPSEKALGKRRRELTSEEDEAADMAAGPKTKKLKAQPRPQAKKGPVINTRPTQRLDVFVFGQGENGELGLGATSADVGVKRPRLNQVLSGKKVGIVQVAAGGMHAIGLTYNGDIYTWGINDQGTLGRDTTLPSGPDDDTGLNTKEATATKLDMSVFPEGIEFTSVAAADSSTFAVTNTGFVYGWGTFRANEGIFGFTKDIKVQRTPMLIAGLKNIKKIACGSNHILALDKHGKTFTWGAGQHNQLGRRIVERTRIGGLTPREFGLPKNAITDIACGEHHSFAIDNKNKVWSWGSNNFGQCGIPQGIGEDDSIVPIPTISESLTAANVIYLDGGVHHSVGINGNGDCLVWGRCDNYQLGIDIEALSADDVVRDANNRIRLVQNPVPIPNLKVVDVAAGSDFCVAVTTQGGAQSWGFGDGYRHGQGNDDDAEEATPMDSKWIRNTTLTQTTVGGQFGILTGPMAVEEQIEKAAEAEKAKTDTAGAAKNAQKTEASSAGPSKDNTKAPEKKADEKKAAHQVKVEEEETAAKVKTEEDAEGSNSAAAGQNVASGEDTVMADAE